VSSKKIKISIKIHMAESGIKLRGLKIAAKVLFHCTAWPIFGIIIGNFFWVKM
jgi:hypothetical protein